jgi:hypothetical protein
MNRSADLFKLLFEHDLRLESLRARHTDRNSQDLTLSIEEFMKPDPTYSRFYLTGTRLDREEFGLNRLEHFPQILDTLHKVLEPYRAFTNDGPVDNLKQTIRTIDIGPAILFTRQKTPASDPIELELDSDSNAGHRKEPLRLALANEELVLYKEKAHHGFDLHLFSKENLYRSFFYPLQALTGPDFRFFSMNGKRIQSERKFYFETWALQRPPHGVEEVFAQTVL